MDSAEVCYAVLSAKEHAERKKKKNVSKLRKKLEDIKTYRELQPGKMLWGERGRQHQSKFPNRCSQYPMGLREESLKITIQCLQSAWVN